MKSEINSTCQKVKNVSTLFNLPRLHRKLKELTKALSNALAKELLSRYVLSKVGSCDPKFLSHSHLYVMCCSVLLSHKYGIRYIKKLL